MSDNSVGQRAAQRAAAARPDSSPARRACRACRSAWCGGSSKGRVPRTPAFIGAVARALKSTPAELQGQPYRGDTAETDRGVAAIGPLRAEVALFDVPEDDIAPSPLEELRARVGAVSKLAHEVEFVRLGEYLPDLLADLRTTAFHSDGAQARDVWAMLAETWSNARMLARILGYPDLAQSMAERYADAAARSGDEYKTLRS